MGVFAKRGEGGKVFPVVPANTYQAVCFGVWDIGNHYNEYKGIRKLKPYVMLGWEVDERNPETEKRFTVFGRYTFYLVDKAKLKADLESWLGRGLSKDECSTFDLESLIGQNCLLNVVHNKVGDKTYVNVKSISPILKGMQAISPENTPVAPAFIQKQIDSAVTEDQMVKDADGEQAPF